MIVFWTLVSSMILLTLLVIIRTLTSKNSSLSDSVEDYDQLYQQRVQEIETDVDNGLLTKEDAEIVLKENQSALSSNTITRDISSYTKPPVLLIFVLFLLIPVLSISFYLYTGESDVMRRMSIMDAIEKSNSDEEKKKLIEELLFAVEKHLEDEPDDIRAWGMLANTYLSMNRFNEALPALENLYRLQGDDNTVRLRYAETLANVSGTFKGLPTELIDKALEENPAEPQALWLAGAAAKERGDNQGIISYWEKLSELIQDNPQVKSQLDLMIAALREEQAIENSEIKDTPAFDESVQINIEVTISNEFADASIADATLFVYAKAVDGRPMPIAALKQQAATFPIKVILDDTSSLMANNRLSSYEEVEVSARFSMTGNPLPQKGDLISLKAITNTHSNDVVRLEINDRIE